MHSSLFSILLATILAGVLSISAAAVFSFSLLSKGGGRMVGLAAGTLLASSLLYALPKAFESNADRHTLFAVLLGGLLSFFLLEKCAILRNARRYEGEGRARAYACHLLCSLTALAGALLGHLMLERGMEWLPYVLVFASSGFIYIAVGDLMPQMQRRATVRETIPQLVLIALAVGLVTLLTARDIASALS